MFTTPDGSGSASIWRRSKWSSASADHRLVLIGIAYRRRVIPLAWTWVRSSRGHSRTSLLAAGVQVSLVGDCEFGHMPLLLPLQAWGWDYVRRQSGQQLVVVDGESDWLRLDALLTRRGDWRFVGDVFLTASAQAPTHLLLAWEHH